MAIKQVTYIELFLTKRALKQFKLYLTKVQLNGLNTTNIEVQYIFSTQEWFTNRLKQIFKSLDKELIAKNKFKNLQ